MPHFEFDPMTNAILANNAGLSLYPNVRCAHEDPAVGIRFFIQGAGPDEEKHVEVVLPRCAMADLIGTLTTLVRLQEGDTAAEKLAQDIATGVQKATDMLGPLHAAGRDCCQAGFMTNGREHTCTQKGQP